MGDFFSDNDREVLEIDEKAFNKMTVKEQNLLIFKNVSGFSRVKKYLWFQGWILTIVVASILYLFTQV